MLDTITHGFLIPLYFFLNSSATPFTFSEQNAKYNEFITVNSFAEFNSNSVNTAFLWKTVGGGYIDNSLKGSVNGRLTDRNRLGMDFNTEIFYTKLGDSLFGGKNWGYYAGIKNRIFAHAGFKPGVFQLGFYGNAPYAGKNVDLSSTSGELVMYQALQVGFIKQFIDKPTKHTIGFGAGFVNGNYHLSFESRSANFYTEPTGQYIDVAADFTARQSNPEYFKPFFPNGQGATFDVFYELRGGKGHALTFQVNDIGFISWSEFSNTLNLDTIARFDGVTATDIFSIGEGTINGIGDSLAAIFNVKQTKGRYTTLLPAHFHLGYTKQYADAKVTLQIGVQYRLFCNYIPNVYLRAYFNPAKWFLIGGGISYGGFGMLQLGVDFGFYFGKGYMIHLNTRNLEGIIPNRYGTGVSAGFRFTKCF